LNKKNELVSAKELCIDDLSDDYDITSECAKKLIDFLGLKKRPLNENDNAAKILGFKNVEEAERAKEILDKYSPEDFAKLDKIKEKVQFPIIPQVVDPKRRAEKIEDEYNNAELINSETKERKVRGYSPKNTKQYLQDIYTNDDKKLVCQICKEEMPFKKKNEEYYFEAIEIFSKTDIIDREMEQPYLALCPECAAKYESGGFVDDSQKK